MKISTLVTVTAITLGVWGSAARAGDLVYAKRGDLASAAWQFERAAGQMYRGLRRHGGHSELARQAKRLRHHAASFRYKLEQRPGGGRLRHEFVMLSGDFRRFSRAFNHSSWVHGKRGLRIRMRNLRYTFGFLKHKSHRRLNSDRRFYYPVTAW